MATNVEKSEYELLREAKISRNNDRLMKLGLLREKGERLGRSNSSKSISHVQNTAVKRKQPLHQEDVDLHAVPLRRSTRLKNHVTSKADDKRPIISNDVGTGGNFKATSQQKVSSNIPIISADLVMAASASLTTTCNNTPKQQTSLQYSKRSSRTISINTSEILSNCLGKYIGKKAGKAKVVEYASGTYQDIAEDDDTTCVHNVSFNKFSGILEWENAVFLWINLGGANKFYDNGRRMSWFGGSRMYDESPIIKRLIEVGQKSASLGNNKTYAKTRCHGSEDIVLWCRFMDRNTCP